VKKKARYEFEEPRSCYGCVLENDIYGTCRGIRDGKMLNIDDYSLSCSTSRHPDCPLQIVPETPEGEPLRWRYGKADETGEYVACPHCAYQILHKDSADYCPFCGKRLLPIMGENVTESVLKPCPFCGEPKADGVTKIIPGYPDKSTPRYEIVCWKCFGRGPDYDTSAEAIAAWNRREG